MPNKKSVKKETDVLYGKKIGQKNDDGDGKSAVKSKHLSVKKVEVPAKQTPKKGFKSDSISQLRTCDATDDHNLSKDDTEETPKKKQKH